MARLRRAWGLLVPIAFVAFYIGLHLWGLHSEGYAYLTQAIRNSTVIQQRVGNVQSTELSFFGGYREKFVGANKSTTMTINVVGQRGSITVTASADKVNGIWTVSDASIDGQRVKLN